MSYEDLPDDMADIPLLEPRFVADVLDLVVSEADRADGALAFLICDEGARLVLPVVVSEPDDASTAAEREQAIATIVSATGGRGSLLVAIARRDGLSITADDLAWARAVRVACAGTIRLLGVHVVTAGGSRQIPAADIAA